MNPGSSCRSSGQRGFVIVAVLWILLALSSLALIFAAYLSASARALALSDASLKTEALVSASLELTAYRLTVTGGKTPPPRGSFQFSMDEANVLVAFTSETARIDLNFASKEVLAGLLVGLGASRDAAKEAADRIIGWRTPPVQGRLNEEGALYDAAGYSPRQAPFVNVNELALVVGLPTGLVDRALPFVTVFNGTPDVDPTIAAPEVIVAMPAVTGKPQGSFDVVAAAPTRRDESTAKSARYRVQTSVSFRSGRETVSEVVIALGNRAEPYRILSWQDDVRPAPTAYGRERL